MNEAALRYGHVLVATDGSPLSAKAVAHAIALARAFNARLTAVHVVAEAPQPTFFAEEVVYQPVSGEQYAQQAARAAAAILDPIQHEAEAAGIACTTTHVLSDRPWHAIIDKVRASGCDVIVMASHGRRGAAALLLGSETHKVLTHSIVPVLVVR